MEELDRDNPIWEGVIDVQVQRTLTAPSPSPSSHGTSSSMYASHQSTQAPLVDSKREQLTVRVLAGSQLKSSGGKVRVVYMEIADDRDESTGFLHFFIVSESDFGGLAAEQQLLVDFGAFPGHLVRLLEDCRASQVESEEGTAAMTTKKYHASLNIKDVGGASSFCIVQTTEFKHVVQLILSTKQANDTAVKKYLAVRVKQTQARERRKDEMIQQMRGELHSLQSASETLQAENLKMKHETKARDSAMRAEHQREVAEIRAQGSSATHALETQHSAAMMELTQRYEKQLEELRNRLEAVQSNCSTQNTEHAHMEATIRELRSTLAASSSDATSSQAMVEKLRSELKESENVRTAQSKELTTLATNVAVLGESLASKTAQLEQAKESLEQALHARAQLEEYCTANKEALAKERRKVESCVAEINKGNTNIARLEEDRDACKRKLKMKSESVRTMEASLLEKSSTIDALQRELGQLRADLERERAGTETATSKISRLRDDLEQSKKTLEDKDNVIRHLNQLLNEQSGPSRQPAFASPAVPGSWSSSPAPPSAIPRFRQGPATTSSASTVSIYSPGDMHETRPGEAKVEKTTPAKPMERSPTLPSSGALASATPPKPSSRAPMVTGGSPGLFPTGYKVPTALSTTPQGLLA